jgi:hypothetical protein
MPRKTRKQLAEKNEEQVQDARDAAYQRLKGELHTAWRQAKSVRSSGTLPEVRAYPSAL